MSNIASPATLKASVLHDDLAFGVTVPATDGIAAWVGANVGAWPAVEEVGTVMLAEGNGAALGGIPKGLDVDPISAGVTGPGCTIPWDRSLGVGPEVGGDEAGEVTVKAVADGALIANRSACPVARITTLSSPPRTSEINGKVTVVSLESVAPNTSAVQS